LADSAAAAATEDALASTALALASAADTESTDELGAGTVTVEA